MQNEPVVGEEFEGRIEHVPVVEVVDVFLLLGLEILLGLLADLFLDDGGAFGLTFGVALALGLNLVFLLVVVQNEDGLAGKGVDDVVLQFFAYNDY